jgi:HTH-type transcriptional regulator, sugar sensing transcriptional regulator
MDTVLLESLGLTHNEAIAYMTLSRIGSSKTGRLLKESGLNTGKVYEILESLKRKGLVSETLTDDVKHFAAAPPDRLIEYIGKKKEVLEQEEKVAKSLIPQIEKIRQSTLETSRVAVYTGFDGFKTAVNEATKTLKAKEEVLAMGVRSSKGESFNRFWKQWADQTLPKNHERVIFSDKGGFYSYKLKSKFSRIRFLESSTPDAIVIFGKHTVLVTQYDDPVKVIFINDEIASLTFISIFELLWKVAKE